MNRVEIKARAKELVKGRLWDFWKGYLLYSILIGIISSAFQIILRVESFKTCLIPITLGNETMCYMTTANLIVEIISGVVALGTAFLALGYLLYVIRYAREESLDVNDIFYYKKMYIPTFLLFFLIQLFTNLWTLLFIVPGIIASLSYAMSKYIYCDQELKPLECIKASKKMMKGHKWDYFIFNLSFVGWIILGMFTFGLLYIWLIPYMSTADVLYYDELKKLESN